MTSILILGMSIILIHVHFPQNNSPHPKPLSTQPKTNEQYKTVLRPTCSAGLSMEGGRADGNW